MFLMTRRRRRYVAKLQDAPTDDLYHRLKFYTQFWRKVRWGDIEGLSTPTLLRHQLSVYRTTLPRLLKGLEEAVGLIADERDQALEQLNANRGSRKQVTLDAFLSDEVGVDIDLGSTCRELLTLLTLLEMDAEQQYRETQSNYIPRVTDYLLHDVVIFTHALFKGIHDDLT